MSKWPIVYRDEYNVRFGGLEKFHPFDASKAMKIFQGLKKGLNLTDNDIYTPVEIKEAELLEVHSKSYIQSLKRSIKVAEIVEIPIIAAIPNYFVQKWYLRAMRYQVGGTILAGELAVEKGWAINLGGGFHHCSSEKGGGFSPYADITILIHCLFKCFTDKIKKVMIVDLDAHQGNGHEADFIDDERVFTLDAYNTNIYPFAHNVKRAITYPVELHNFTDDDEYLPLIERGLEESLRRFRPDIIVYNAGTDILIGDPLGKLSISVKGIIHRDQIVFMKARERRIPIVMLTSGGYSRESFDVITRSILNLVELGLIFP